jgi:hypothetical protein
VSPRRSAIIIRTGQDNRLPAPSKVARNSSTSLATNAIKDTYFRGTRSTCRPIQQVALCHQLLWYYLAFYVHLRRLYRLSPDPTRPLHARLGKKISTRSSAKKLSSPQETSPQEIIRSRQWVSPTRLLSLIPFPPIISAPILFSLSSAGVPGIPVSVPHFFSLLRIRSTAELAGRFPKLSLAGRDSGSQERCYYCLVPTGSHVTS